ncbi:hypothetical protein DFH94DRAFT_800139 [Russula ochroleuca]|uniref:Uncharacterized protein n=1 Tax=Russula ochroleuca TaxID=152965 RepID=A0A9P5T7U1_9AGAM|nr:hypothetical protein DFH94DRAFT_800139 [Russula ochroleuca]
MAPAPNHKMPAYPQQTYRQYPQEYPSTPSQNSRSRSPPRPGVPYSMASGFSQSATPSYYDAQSYTTDVYRDQPAVPTTGPTYSNDTYGLGGGSIPGYDPNYAVAGSWGTPPPQLLYNSVYSMVSVPHPMPSYPSIPYSNLGQGETSYDGYHFGAYQVPSPTMNFSPHLQEANANEGASHEWRFHNCWVSHAGQDEIHLTIALKKT